MKTKQFKTVRAHVGYLCKLEGGKSQAKIHDAIQILNLHYDLILEEIVSAYRLTYNDVESIPKKAYCSISNSHSLLLKHSAKRWLKKNKKK